MICNFCLEKPAVINLIDKYKIIFLFENTLNEKAWACEECHKKFRDNKGTLHSKKGFYVEIPRK